MERASIVLRFTFLERDEFNCVLLLFTGDDDRSFFGRRVTLLKLYLIGEDGSGGDDERSLFGRRVTLLKLYLIGEDGSGGDDERSLFGRRLTLLKSYLLVIIGDSRLKSKYLA